MPPTPTGEGAVHMQINDESLERLQSTIEVLAKQRNQLSYQLSEANATIARMNSAALGRPSQSTFESMLHTANASAANVTSQRDALYQQIQGYDLRIEELERFLKNSQGVAAHVNVKAVENEKARMALAIKNEQLQHDLASLNDQFATRVLFEVLGRASGRAEASDARRLRVAIIRIADQDAIDTRSSPR